MYLGKRVRLERIADRNTRKTVLVPLTHGIGMGPIEGIQDIQNIIDVVSMAGANAIVLNKGVVPRAHRGKGKDIGLVLQLTGGPEHNYEVPVCSVEEAIRVGADAVRFRMVMGGNDERPMLELLGQLSRSALDWGMPFIVTVSLVSEENNHAFPLISRGARIAAELGADIIGIPYPGSRERLLEVLQTTPAPIIVAGGEKVEKPGEILDLVHTAISAGAHGVSIGRNVFQYSKPGNMLKAISILVHEGASVKTASAVLDEAPLVSTLYSPPIW